MAIAPILGAPPPSALYARPVSRIAVYGASGYTGRLVAAELARGGHDVVLAGRDAARLRAAGSAAAVAIAPLDDARALARALEGCDVVVNCAGPFLEHGAPVLEAAIGAGAGYVDTAAEQAWVHEVFERYGPLAAARGVALVPAAGFDFLPGDLACALAADGLGPLRELEVAYAVDHFRMSRGTLRSALAGMARRALAYEDGQWRFAPRGTAAAGRRFEFPPPFGARFVAPFPAGEVITAPRHVDVRSVRPLVAARTLTLGAEPLAPFVAPVLPLAGALVRGPVPRVADAIVARLPEGPSEDSRRRARWMVVAAAHAADGRSRRVAVSGSDVYGTTAASAAHAAALLATTGAAGALAPAQAFDPDAFLDHLGAARAAA
jgi:short subunit dehydrogenase-like uncharacterized protein